MLRREMTCFTAALRCRSCMTHLRYVLRRNQCRRMSLSAKDAATEMMTKYEGETFLQSQYLDPNQTQKLSLMLNRPELQPGIDVRTAPPKAGTPLPAGYHLVYLTPASLEDDLGDDASDITFRPPGTFRRRMWAGGSMEWKMSNRLRIGDHVTESTRLLSAMPKTSRGGHEMVLVEIEKVFANAQGVALIDRRSFIFQPDNMRFLRTSTSQSIAAAPGFPYKSSVHDTISETNLTQRHFVWSPAALFRFSALSYNGHMIHYSDAWCRNVEGFPRPVVHSPLNLINMLNFWRDVNGRDGALPLSIKYRAFAPLFAGSPYVVDAGETKQAGPGEKNCAITVRSGDDKVHMTGDISFA